MAKRALLVVGFIVLLTWPNVVLAQGMGPSPLPSDSSPLGRADSLGWISGIGSLPRLDWIQPRSIRIWPSFNVGYKKIAFNFNLNIPPTQLLSPFGIIFPQYGSLLDLYPLDAKIQSANLAVGAVRLDAQITPTCGLFGSVSANVPRTVGIEASAGPAIGVIPPQAWRWTGSGFQWSEFEVGGWYTVNHAVGLVAGIRFDRFSVRFSEPEPVPNYGVFTIFPLPPTTRAVTFPDFSGDLDTFLTIPYIGCEILGPYFKGALLIGSAGANLRLPLDLTHAGAYISGPIFGALGRRDISEQAEYTFKNAGLFLEASLESTFPVRFFNCTLWAKGNWLRIRGDGDVALAGQSSVSVLVFRLPQPFSASTSGTSTLNQYSFDVGFSGAINF